MILQWLVDGLLVGMVIGLGAVGLSLTYAILRFANFAHGEYVSWGAYFCLALTSLTVGMGAGFGRLSFGWPLLLSLLISMCLTALLALALEYFVFSRLHKAANRMVVVMASFGVALSLRSLIELFYTSQPRYFSADIQMALRLPGSIRVTPDQLAVFALTLVLVLALHLLLTRTHLGMAMRATSENASLAQVAGIDTRAAMRIACGLGAALAAIAGVFHGVLTQVRPSMGFDLLLPLFSAVVLGGIGSIPGALLGGIIIGLAESFAAPLVGSEYRAAVAFGVLILVLLFKPHGLFGGKLS